MYETYYLEYYFERKERCMTLRAKRVSGLIKRIKKITKVKDRLSGERMRPVRLTKLIKTW